VTTWRRHRRSAARRWQARPTLGRKKGYRPSEKHAEKVLELEKDGLCYRPIGRNLGLSKNRVMEIVQRARAVV
jgi:hypothetical protein